MSNVIRVRILDNPIQVDRPFDYLYSLEQSPLLPGDFVRVPFGKGNKEKWAIVTGDGEEVKGISLKSVISVLDKRFSLTKEMFGLCLFLSDYYLCSLGDVVKAVLPPTLLSNEGASIQYSTSYAANLTREEYEVLLASKMVRSEAHKNIITYLLANGITEKDKLLEKLDVSPSQIASVLEHQWIVQSKKEFYRNPYQELGQKRNLTKISLSTAQLKAYDELTHLRASGEAKAALFYGITGSGKTQVMLKLIDDVLQENKTVLLMVPEIALTPQTVSIFCKRYGERVAVIHSSLSQGERFDAYRRIQGGQVDLVIGTRSAVFAPLQNIGLILVDEEHEHTYKSDMDPKYHVRVVCAYRAKEHHALTVFASATPSFESYYKAQKGVYSLVTLTERFGGAKLPDTTIIDLRNELKHGNTSGISKTLQKSLQECLDNKEQAILFLNHRGYNSAIQCRSCGEALSCPHCSLTLTYHSIPYPHLKCHLCGYVEPVHKKCPQCGEEHLKFLGVGTQKIEKDLQSFFPTSRVLRMDADTTTKKQSYDAILTKFRNLEGDILLGTQMVTKGHDFPKVTLSGVVLADLGLYAQDFRASEKTFSLLTQVIGRAGRSVDAGKAIIQTFSPQNEVIVFAKNQDYPSFYNSEIKLREELNLPPFVDYVELKFSSSNEKELQKEVERCLEEAKELAQKEYPHLKLEIIGPLEAPVYKENESYKLLLNFKTIWQKESRSYLYRIMTSKNRNYNVSCAIDLNPL